MDFYGYRRPDGKVGIRNRILILPTCACSVETCRLVASQVPGTVYINNPNGCGQIKPDIAITEQVLAGYAANPNVYGTVLIGLGCEINEPLTMMKRIADITNKPLSLFIIQEEGGTVETVKKAVRCAQQYMIEASMCTKEKCNFSELIVGTECGGSDATSGIAANPAVGNLSDRLVDLGSTVILCETTEFIGAEHLLARRGINPKVSEEILRIVKKYDDLFMSHGFNARKGQPTPGNIAGGITTCEEKSLGCIYKGGTKSIMDVIQYAEIPTQKGLIIMDTPGYDIASVTGMVAGGCQLVVFTTGRGTPTGNGIAPVIKITGNKRTYETMKDNTDLDVSVVISGSKTVEEVGATLLNEVLEVCNGKSTKAEAFGFNEIAICRVCNYG